RARLRRVRARAIVGPDAPAAPAAVRACPARDRRRAGRAAPEASAAAPGPRARRAAGADRLALAESVRRPLARPGRAPRLRRPLAALARADRCAAQGGPGRGARGLRGRLESLPGR